MAATAAPRAHRAVSSAKKGPAPRTPSVKTAAAFMSQADAVTMPTAVERTAVGKSSASSTLTAAQAHSENTKFRNSTARYSWAAAPWTAARAIAVARPPAGGEEG